MRLKSCMQKPTIWLSKPSVDKMRVSNSGQHHEDAILDCQEGHIQQFPTYDMNENIALARTLSCKALRNGCSGGSLKVWST